MPQFLPVTTLCGWLETSNFVVPEGEVSGIIINSKLKWNDHSQYVVSEATKHLNCIHRAMYGCIQAAKISAYKAHVRPHLKYACAVWSPYTTHDIGLLELVQHRAACWIKSFWDSSANKWSKSSIVCVDELGWPSFKARRIFISIWTLYSIFYKQTAIDFSKYFHFNRLTTRSHSLTLNLVSSTINAFRHSFFLWLYVYQYYGTPYHWCDCS